jgi:hypothetical protein
MVFVKLVRATNMYPRMESNASARNVTKGRFWQPTEIAKRAKNLRTRLPMASIASPTSALEGRSLILRVDVRNVKNTLHQLTTERSAKIIARGHKLYQKMARVKAAMNQSLKNYLMKQDVQISQGDKKMGNVDLMTAGKLRRSLSSVAARLVMTSRERKAHTMSFVELMFVRTTNNFFRMESARPVRHTPMLVMTRRVAWLRSAKRITGTLMKTGIANIVRRTLTDLIYWSNCASKDLAVIGKFL